MRFSLLSQLLLGLTASVVVQGAPSNSLALRDGLVARGMPYLNLRNLGANKQDNSSNDNQGKQEGQGNQEKGNNSNKDDGKNGNNDNDNKNNDNKNNNKNNNNNNKEVEVKVVEVAKSIEKDGKKITFVEKVTQILIKNKNNNKKKDRKRKNAMKKNRKMNNKTVVIQVVQVIIDVENGGKKRYAMKQQMVNKGANETVTAQMTDANTMTVGAGDCGNEEATATAAGSAASEAVMADATGTAVAMAMSTDSAAAAEMDMSDATMIMPEEDGAPKAEEGVMEMEDPAADMAAGEVSQCGM